ncbi:MAG: nickel/cobalt transporter [Alphaproteobacteria bacterium]
MTARVMVPAALIVGIVSASLLFLLLVRHGDTGLWSRLVLEIQHIQRDLHRQLTGAMHAVATGGASAAWSLVALSFLYGVFHAAGPGHGKLVISTYLLTQESRLRRGIALSLIAAFAQGVTAVLIVEATVSLLGLTLRQADGAATKFEAVSYALVALVGVLLIVTRGRRLGARLSGRSPPHGHDHSHGETCADCGHAHGPPPHLVEAPVSVRTLIALVLSVGIRPCSGAVLVLLAAHALNLPWAGIGAVLAMSLGTGLTVSLLATLSVYFRKGALRLAAALPGRAAGIATAIDVVGVIGGLVVLAAGVLLLQSAWLTPAHPLR